MSIIRPFAGIRYNLSRGIELSQVLAPPYDVIKPEFRDVLEARSPWNVIRLILPREKPGDGPRSTKYRRAAELFRRWREEGILVRDEKPAFYRYHMSFQQKNPGGIVEKERPGFVALLKLHDYSEGKVLPHERTLAGPKEDRFQLLSYTRAHFSQVFLLYPDPEGVVEKVMPEKCSAEGFAWSAEDDLGVRHTMWPVTDAEIIGRVTAHLETRPLYIADGHHRYETALAYLRHLHQHSPLFAHNSDYIMAYFTSLEHPGLTIFPYHRLLHHLPKRRLSGLLKKLEENFKIERALLSPLTPGAPRRDFMRELSERGIGHTVFGMVDGATGHAYYLSRKADPDKNAAYASEMEMVLASMDVVVLEQLILDRILGIKHQNLLNEKFITYETDHDQALAALSNPPNQILFLMNPTPVHHVTRVADRRGIMPEKSTYFFPKLATGLVMNALDET